MSHFTVMVVGEPVEELLQPFHEYECTGYEDEYVVFVPIDMGDVQKEYESDPDYKKEYPTIENFIEDWYGGSYYKKHNAWGSYTNPNAKWDWWVRGGRWSNTLHLKETVLISNKLTTEMNEFGFSDAEMNNLFKLFLEDKSKFDRIISKYNGKSVQIEKTFIKWLANKYPKIDCSGNEGTLFNRANVAIKHTIDIESMEKPMIKQATETWVGWHENDIKLLDDDSPKKKKWIEEHLGWFIHNNVIKQLDKMSKEEYIVCQSTWSPYAVVWNGKWYSEGEMHMFGVSLKEESDWGTQFKLLWADIGDDEIITMVDCHS